MHLIFSLKTATGRILVAVFAALCPAAASAHAFGERYELPLPLELFLTGAGVTVLLTFLLLAVLPQRPVGAPAPVLALSRCDPLAATMRVAGAALRVLSVLVFVSLCFAGFFGSQDTFHNILPTVLWVGLWVGMAYLAALVGNPWRLINPYGVLFDWADAAAQKIFKLRSLSLERPYPTWLGAWPAAAGLIVIAWLELVPEDAERPAALATGMVVYGLYCLTGMMAFGRNVWLEHADVFTVAFGVLGRFAPIGHREPERADGGGWVLRIPGGGLLGTKPVSSSMMVFVLLMLSNVTFDGFLETPVWNDLLGFVATSTALRPSLLDLQSMGVNLLDLVKTTGLVAFFGIFAGVYLFFGLLMSWAAGAGTGPVALCRWLVLTLVPIAIAYHVAHYAFFLLLAGQFLIPLASDPLGFGWDLFGTASYHVDVGIISARFVWYTSLVTIVIGHVIAVILAHAQAGHIFGRERRVLLSQIPMLVLMIGYTMSSLWILSQPVVKSQALG